MIRLGRVLSLALVVALCAVPIAGIALSAETQMNTTVTESTTATVTTQSGLCVDLGVIEIGCDDDDSGDNGDYSVDGSSGDATSLTDTPTDTPTETPTQTLTETKTDTPTDTQTDTPTDTPSDTPTQEPTETETDTQTNTLRENPTATPTDTESVTETETETNTPTQAPTDTGTDTATETTPDYQTTPPPDSGTEVKILTPTRAPPRTSTQTETPTTTPPVTETEAEVDRTSDTTTTTTATEPRETATRRTTPTKTGNAPQVSEPTTTESRETTETQTTTAEPTTITQQGPTPTEATTDRTYTETIEASAATPTPSTTATTTGDTTEPTDAPPQTTVAKTDRATPTRTETPSETTKNTRETPTTTEKLNGAVSEHPPTQTRTTEETTTVPDSDTDRSDGLLLLPEPPHDPLPRNPLPAGIGITGSIAVAYLIVRRSDVSPAGPVSSVTYMAGMANTGGSQPILARKRQYTQTLIDRLYDIARWGWWFIPIGYSRWDDSDPLEHPTREAIHEAIQRDQGQTVDDMAELGKAIAYHAGILAFEDELLAETRYSTERWFLSGEHDESLSDTERELVHIHKNEDLEPLFDMICMYDGNLTQNDLAAVLGLSKSTISRRLKKLKDNKIIKYENKGQSKYIHLGDEIRGLY